VVEWLTGSKHSATLRPSKLEGGELRLDMCLKSSLVAGCYAESTSARVTATVVHG
jgi:hypothetical protein